VPPITRTAPAIESERLAFEGAANRELDLIVMPQSREEYESALALLNRWQAIRPQTMKSYGSMNDEVGYAVAPAAAAPAADSISVEVDDADEAIDELRRIAPGQVQAARSLSQEEAGKAATEAQTPPALVGRNTQSEAEQPAPLSAGLARRSQSATPAALPDDQRLGGRNPASEPASEPASAGSQLENRGHSKKDPMNRTRLHVKIIPPTVMRQFAPSAEPATSQPARAGSSERSTTQP
jgi:hypothetical protein